MSARLGARLDHVLEELVVDDVMPRGQLTQHGGCALHHQARLWVEEQELLLHPEGTARHGRVEPGP